MQLTPNRILKLKSPNKVEKEVKKRQDFNNYLSLICGESWVQPLASIYGKMQVDIIKAKRCTETSRVVITPRTINSGLDVPCSYWSSTKAT